MGAEESREEKEVKGVPLLKNTEYGTLKIISSFSENDFGGVYKVQDVKTKLFYVMKSVGVDVEAYMTNNKNQGRHENSLSEIKILSEISSHSNIVGLHGSFTLDRNPAKKGSKSKKSSMFSEWVCILLEYCHGDNIEALLQKIESSKDGSELPDSKTKKKKKKKKKKNEKIIPLHARKLPKDQCLVWFIQLLETIKYLHSKHIIYGNLHPENILLRYDSLSPPLSQIKLKLSNFRCSKNIILGILPKENKGHVYFSSPEAIDPKREFDTKADIWSLGIVFLCLWLQMSMQQYIRKMQKMLFKIKSNPELRDKFCERFKLEDPKQVHQAQTTTFLTFFTEKKELMDELIQELLSKSDDGDNDAACVGLVKKMLTPSPRERPSAAELLQSSTLKTWKYLLLNKKKSQKGLMNSPSLYFGSSNIVDISDSTWLDMKGLITVMKIRDAYLFKKCMLLLKEFVLKDPLLFVTSGGIEVLLRRMEGMTAVLKKEDDPRRIQFEVLLSDFITLTTSILCFLQTNGQIKLFGRSIRRIIRGVREFNCLPTLRSLLQFQKRESLYYFTHLLCSNSKSIRCELLLYDKDNKSSQVMSESVFDWILKNMTPRNRVFALSIISSFIPQVSASKGGEKFIEVIMQKYQNHGYIQGEKLGNDLRFFKKMAHRSSIAFTSVDNMYNEDFTETKKMILYSLFEEIKNVIKEEEEEEEEGQKTSERSTSLEEEEESSKLCGLLSCVIFLLQNYFDVGNDDEQLFVEQEEQEKIEFSFNPEYFPNRNIQLTYGIGSQVKNQESETAKIFLDPETRTFVCLTKEEHKNMEIISDWPLTKISPSIFTSSSCQQQLCCVCYYEVEVVNGGMEDDIMLGLRNTTNGYQIHLHLSTGEITMIQVYDRKSSKKKKHQQGLRYIKIAPKEFNKNVDGSFCYCEIGDFIGCGMTNKGQFFWTKNNNVINKNHMIQFFDESFFSDEGGASGGLIDFKISIIMAGNLGFVGKLNFGYLLNLPRKAKLEEEEGEEENEEVKKEEDVFSSGFKYRFTEVVEKDGTIRKRNDGGIEGSTDSTLIQYVETHLGASKVMESLKTWKAGQDRCTNSILLPELIEKMEELIGTEKPRDPRKKRGKNIRMKKVLEMYRESTFEKNILRSFQGSAEYKRHHEKLGQTEVSSTTETEAPTPTPTPTDEKETENEPKKVIQMKLEEEDEGEKMDEEVEEEPKGTEKSESKRKLIMFDEESEEEMIEEGMDLEVLVEDEQVKDEEEEETQNKGTSLKRKIVM